MASGLREYVNMDEISNPGIGDQSSSPSLKPRRPSAANMRRQFTFSERRRAQKRGRRGSTMGGKGMSLLQRAGSVRKGGGGGGGFGSLSRMGSEKSPRGGASRLFDVDDTTAIAAHRSMVDAVSDF